MSGTSAGERGNAYRAIRRSPCRAHRGRCIRRTRTIGGTDVAMVGVEHDAPATRLLGEYACHDARQKYRAEAAADDLRVRYRGVQSHIVGIGDISGGDGILCGPVKFDVTVVLAAETTDEWTRVRAIELGPQIPPPAPRRPVVLPRLRQMRAVYPLRHHVGVCIGFYEADGIGIGVGGGPTSRTSVEVDVSSRGRTGSSASSNIGHRPTSLPQQMRIGLPT